MGNSLTRWTRPDSYAGPSYDEYYHADGLGRTRDSSELEESNHAVALRTLRAIEEEEEVPERYERTARGIVWRDDSELRPAKPGWRMVRDSHWAVGWIEYILIHESREDLIAVVSALVDRVANYPVLDEDDFSRREQESADRMWRDCYTWRERIAYMREHRSQFDIGYTEWRYLRAQARGEYFGGYASELIG